MGDSEWGQKPQKMNKKNMPMKCVLGYSKSFETNIFFIEGVVPPYGLGALCTLSASCLWALSAPQPPSG